MGGSNGGQSLYPSIGIFNGQQQGINQSLLSQAQALLGPSELVNMYSSLLGSSLSQAAQAAQSQAVQEQMGPQPVPSPVEQAKVKLEIAQPGNSKRAFLSEDEA